MEQGTPAWLRSAIERIETDHRLDRVDERLTPIAATVADGDRGDVLRGRWLGHALHPLLTDFPLGCWIGAGILDLVGGRRSRRAAQRLVGLGVLAVVPTAASGLADWSPTTDARARRVGVVHAVGNLAATVIYVRSWSARRRGNHLRGAVLGLAGGALAGAAGYLGGHLSFNLGVGVGDRGISRPEEAGSDRSNALIDATEAAELLDVPQEQLRTMVDDGLLRPIRADDGHDRFRRSAVLALRLPGG